ncbi:hypothetical protein Bca52824_017627 [Brassica carinata]|uniref:Endonuclease/exonuclease/phosphatase domain-containing protein n=1 Tax=Brassica carinata TaxID=52824 RepID=A0A8X7VPF5_BRACI|nr:hypothetical protein Bca52824_017627 [Brassica carinata]
MSIKLSFWNVRGLNDPDKHHPFCQWLLFYKPIVGAILESHIKEVNLNRLMSKLCPSWKFATNHQSDEDGRIILIWKDPATVRVINQSRQTLTCEVVIPTCTPFIFTCVYASNLAEERSELWVELLNLQASVGLTTQPWIVGGDFNQILHHAEHSSLHVNSNNSRMHEFGDCLLQSGLFDLRFLGPVLTWMNHQPDSPIAKKLDRLLVNNLAIAAFPNALASFLPPLFSDHSPCLLDLAYPLPVAGTRPFKFLNYLTKHPSFLHVVKMAWSQAGSTSATLANLCWKLKNIKSDLKLLNKEYFSKIQERVSDINCLLQNVQVQALNSPSPQLFQEERDLHQKWLFLREIEECFFRQKSRINWLREGDLNTAYFFRICQSRASYNAIRSFVTTAGVVIQDPLEMSFLAVNHFKAVLASRACNIFSFFLHLI